MDYLANSASDLWPCIRKQDYIRNYSGILPKWVDDQGVIQDFKIEIRDDLAPRAINLVGKMCIRDREQIKEELEDLIRQRKDYSLKDSQFHEQIANCSHNQIMTNLVPVITEGVRMFAVSVQETEYEMCIRDRSWYR